jgi:hypothetical protein
MTRKGCMFIVALATLLEASVCLTCPPLVHAMCKDGPCHEPGDDPDPPPPPPPPPPIGGGLTLEPRYKIEAVSFHCHNETGINWPGSDEIVVVIDTCPDDVNCVTTFSKIFGDVDSSETREFEPDESCILPIGDATYSAYGGYFRDQALLAFADSWSCSGAGVPGPFGFTVSMYDDDSGFFHDCFSGASDSFDDCIYSPDFGPDHPNLPVDSNDDLIDRRMILFTAEELAAALPNVNDTVERTIRLEDCPDNTICGGWYTKYSFTYRLTRLPDALVGPVGSIPIEEAPVQSDPGLTP